MEAYREVLQDKLRQFHQNYGTAGCQFALEQRKRSCVALGLLKKEQRRLVTTLFQFLPTEDEFGESSRLEDHGDDSTTYEESVDSIPSATDKPAVPSVQGATSENENSSDGDIFITPLPSLQTPSTAPPGCSKFAQKRLRPAYPDGKGGKKWCKNSILKYFSSSQK